MNDKKLKPDFDFMDSDPFYVCCNLDARLYGSNCPHYGIIEQIRIFGKQGWGVDPANIKCPVFYYHPELDAEIPRACADHFHGTAVATPPTPPEPASPLAVVRRLSEELEEQEE